MGWKEGGQNNSLKPPQDIYILSFPDLFNPISGSGIFIASDKKNFTSLYLLGTELIFQ